MTLTLSHGPLAGGRPDEANYRIEGPEHVLFLDRFPRRVRAELGGRTVFDTRRGRLLHETGYVPVLYVPEDDVDRDLLLPSDHTTHCPFKGDASYWTVQAGGSTAENAAWSYPEPIEGASWLAGHLAFYWHLMDAWYDEAERVHGHLRDPYHRVDARPSSQRVRVSAGDTVLAESDEAMVVSETGLPTMYYLPRGDVREDLRPSDKRTVCPYKGTASYWSSAELDDIGWSFEEPLQDSARFGGYVCFDHGNVTVDLV